MKINYIATIVLTTMPAVNISSWSDRYEAPKWIVFYLFSLILLLELKNPFFSFNRMNLKITTVLIFFSFVLSAILGAKGFLPQQFLDWVCFFIITIYIVQNKNQNNRIFSAIQIGNLISIFIISFLYFQSKIENGLTFGHKNYFGEYLAISTLLQVDFYFKIKSNFKYISLIVIPLCIWLLLKQLSISAIVGLFISGSSYVIFKRFKEYKKIRLFYVLLTLPVFLILLFTQIDRNNLTDDKTVLTKLNNLQIRLIRWKNTWTMISDNPLGVGPGNFEYTYLKYHNSYQQDPESNENSLVESPHNGYLELMAENGILSVIFIMYFLNLLLKELVTNKENENNIILISIWSFILFDCFFSFPMENAFTFLIAAITLGFSISTNHIKSIPLPYFKFIKLITFILVTFLIIGYYISRSSEDSDNYELLSLSCEIFPSYPENCVEAGYMEFDRGLYEKSLLRSKRLLAFYPHNYRALWLRGASLINLNQMANACEDLNKYNSYFKNENMATPLLNSYCSQY